MRKLRKPLRLSGIVLFVGLFASSVYASDRMHILTGEAWLKLSPEQKVMFISGVCHVVNFERNLIGKQPSPDSKSFIPLLINGLRGKRISEIVKQLDAYYEANPGERSEAVFDGIFQAVIFPGMNEK